MHVKIDFFSWPLDIGGNTNSVRLSFAASCCSTTGPLPLDDYVVQLLLDFCVWGRRLEQLPIA